MIINCMYCGHTISLAEAYDSYRGPVRCAVCKNLMMVEIADGHMSSMAPGPDVGRVPPPAAPLLSPLAPTAPPRASHAPTTVRDPAGPSV